MVVELIAAGLGGMGIGWVLSSIRVAEIIKGQRKRIDELGQDRLTLFRTLSALRSNCFITNERGHRVRYVNASVECRAVAEKLHAPE